MVRSFRRGAVAAVLALSLAPLAAACSAGTDAQSLGVHPNTDSGAAGDVLVQSAFVLTDPSGPASVTARLFNNGNAAQSLQAVQIAGEPQATLVGAKGAPGTITVPAHGSVLLGGTGNPAVVLAGSSESLRDGDVQDAVFTFSAAGPVKMQVNVTPAAGYFQAYGPRSVPTTAAPSPTATLTPAKPKGGTPGKATGTATPTGKATGKATATPTGTATP